MTDCCCRSLGLCFLVGLCSEWAILRLETLIIAAVVLPLPHFHSESHLRKRNVLLILPNSAINSLVKVVMNWRDELQ